jgi:hypothetical protein
LEFASLYSHSIFYFEEEDAQTAKVKLASNNCTSCFFSDSDDNVDMNLEEMMVTEAIWRSIQVRGNEL